MFDLSNMMPNVKMPEIPSWGASPYVPPPECNAWCRGEKVNVVLYATGVAIAAYAVGIGVGYLVRLLSKGGM